MTEIANAPKADTLASRSSSADSPFHTGELAIQERVGVLEKIDAWGRKGIRSFMPDQHRQFFQGLSYFFIGSIDQHGRPWASILTGEPGFITSPDPKTLCFSNRPAPGDPLTGGLYDGAVLGGLGIEFHTRRRNRVNGKAAIDPNGGFSLSVDQSFGNCAKYIQARIPLPRIQSPAEIARPRQLSAFDDDMRRIIARADTFFIVSKNIGDPADPRTGVDISHRGGPVGFVDLLDERTLQWPDYKGNFFFNTLGNIALHPHCGLLFVDFDRGGTLQLSGHGEILWDWDRSRPALRDAQRVVSFHLDTAVQIENGLPLVWKFLGHAPQFTEAG